jgi:hypothetical protein
MKPRIRGAWVLLIAGLWLLAGVATAQNGIILDQDLDGSNQGYTVMRVWGTHYEMGYAQANLLGDYIVDAVDETKAYAGPLYNAFRNSMATAVWKPDEIEDELDGMVASLAITHPSAGIDKLDLKVINTYGDLGYACRSHIAWGRYVAPPIKTLATRRLDFGSPVDTAHHHVLLARDPGDGSPRWVNLAWPGAVAAATGVNEFGTLVSLHDYESTGADIFSANRMPRMVAARYALTFPSGTDVSTHLSQVVTELESYEIMTGGFINFYAPEGHGGVMTVDPYQSGPDLYDLRVPQAVWHHGEAMITTNQQTDGTYTPGDEDFDADDYYGDESPKTLESHWDLLAAGGNALHLMSVAYRGRGDMTVWADGRLDHSRTARLEWDWAGLFGPLCDDGVDNDADGRIDWNGGPLGEPADPGCENALDLSERSPLLACDDGADNDGDGGFDFDTATYADPGDETTPPAGSGDPGCAEPSWGTESPKCQDGIDNDGDGKIDYDAGYSANGSPHPAGPDPQCVGGPSFVREASGSSCGLSAELVLLLPPLLWLWRRRVAG